MGPEANAGLIRVLEKRIEEGSGDTIKLKRDRNSLLNISTRVPPEILGYIFVWSLDWENCRYFDGIQEGFYNFLLVCYHWFDVASHTPELWSFWGNTLQDWKKRHHRSGATPLDLVLVGDESDPGVLFEESLKNAVRTRVIQDTMRQVHLTSNDGELLASIISSLTPDDGSGQNDNIESIVLENCGHPVVNISDFFARSRLSKLCWLDLGGNLWISSWDHLASRATLLTTLTLNISGPLSSPTLTTSRLLSILISNPNLQELTLANITILDDVDGSTFKVQLRSLKKLNLTGEFCHIFGLLHRLILPEMLDRLGLAVSNSTVEDISQSLAPYMRDYFRRDPRFQGRLGVSSSSYDDYISIAVGVVHTQTTAPRLKLPRVLLTVLTNQPPDVLEQLLTNLIALVPQDHVVFFDADINAMVPEELFFAMPNIETLHLSNMLLSEGFLQPDPAGPNANTKLFPSLRLLRLEDVDYLNDEDWSLLKTYLTHQTSDGQAISLEVIGSFPSGPPEMVNGIRGLVKEFAHHQGVVVEDEEDEE